MKVHAIASARVNADKADAMILAPSLRAELVAESYVPPSDLKEEFAQVKNRLSLVKMRYGG
jgi:LytS/YehU family sensor histidine kinase